MKTYFWTILLGVFMLIGCTAAPSDAPAPSNDTEEATTTTETVETEAETETTEIDAENGEEAANNNSEETETVEIEEAEEAESEETSEPEAMAEEVDEAEEVVEEQEEAMEETEEAEESAESSLIPAAFTESVPSNGEILILYGQVLATDGTPQADTAIEIWQTDQIGVYDHPDDPGTNDRDQSFQFFGTAVTDTDGWFVFRTILPGEYEPRPRHIHFKIKQNRQTLLTSQLYFSEDIADVEDEGMFAAVGDQGDLLLLQLVQGDTTLLAEARVVVDTGIGAGELPLTPSQAEGPFYPVVPLADYDNDLVVLP